MDDRLRNTGSVWPTANLHDTGRARCGLTVAQADAILHRMEETPEVNSQASRSQKHQKRWSLNVWAGILADCLLGPYLLPERLSEQSYLVVLNEVLTKFLDGIPLAAIHGLWFQRDGAPAHFCAHVRDWLDVACPGRWIGRQGSVLWPPRLPDLTPLDFFQGAISRNWCIETQWQHKCT
ncbi:DUF4817 domain-containing protein [Trichonephila clavipes]|nr:DUF4817 domain-containing protein [Trichonephila clavipes]